MGNPKKTEKKTGQEKIEKTDKIDKKEKTEKPERKPGLSVSSLKFIAMAAMLLDHIGLVLIENGYLASFKDKDILLSTLPLFWVNFIIRIIGKIAFPIYAFLIVEGYKHTRDIRKYLIRLLVFGLIAEIPFDFAYRSSLSLNAQNVIFTLTLGLVSILTWDAALGKDEDGNRMNFFLISEKRKFLAVFSLLLYIAFATFFRVDYYGFGVAIVWAMYVFKDSIIYRNVTTGVLLALGGPLDIGGLIAFIPLKYYNGEKGLNLKYLFYAFYPLHLGILVGIKYLIYG